MTAVMLREQAWPEDSDHLLVPSGAYSLGYLIIIAYSLHAHDLVWCLLLDSSIYCVISTCLERYPHRY